MTVKDVSKLAASVRARLQNHARRLASTPGGSTEIPSSPFECRRDASRWPSRDASVILDVLRAYERGPS